MQILILAAGDNERWWGRVPKQLVQIEGKPLIRRTVEQVIERAEPVVITHNPAIQAAVPYFAGPEASRYITETLLSTAYLWQGRTIILLGDVIYSDETIKAIFANRKPVAVFGRKWEIFAVAFNKQMSKKVIKALELAIANGEAGGRAKLWEFYHAYCEMSLTEVHYLEDKIFVPVEDYTDDIDTLEQYGDFLQANSWAGSKSMSDIVREYGL